MIKYYTPVMFFVADAAHWKQKLQQFVSLYPQYIQMYRARREVDLTRQFLIGLAIGSRHIVTIYFPSSTHSCAENYSL